MNIVLINPLLPYDSIGISSGERFFPEGLAVIASALRAGHNVKVIDLCAQQQLTPKVCDDAEIFGITGMINQFGSIENIIATLRELSPKAKIMLGGPLVTCAPELIKRLLGFDLAVIGEGEKSVVELLQDNHGERVATNSGDAYLPPEDFILPAFELFDLSWYLSGPVWPHYLTVEGMSKGIVNNLMLSRGCPRHKNCDFCGQLFGQRMRCKPFHLVEKEIQTWINAGALAIRFQDDNLSLLPAEMQERIFDLVSGQKMAWAGHSRVDTINPLKLTQMRRAGCKILYFGLESFSEEALSSAGKGATVAAATKAINMTLEAGIKPACFFVIGLPGETRKSLQTAVSFARDRQILVRPYILYPIPGTPIFERAKPLINDMRDYLRHCSHWADDQLAEGKLYINLTDLSDDLLLETYRELRELGN